MTVLMHPTVCMHMLEIDRHETEESSTKDLHRDRHTMDQKERIIENESIGEQTEEQSDTREDFRGIIKKEWIGDQTLHLKEEEPESEINIMD